MSKELLYVPFLEDAPTPFSSFDLGLSAGLVSIGFPLLKIHKNSGGKALFLFEASDEILESAQMYWRGELQTDALTYFNALKNLKNQLYSS